MSSLTTWRMLLGQLINQYQEQQRLALILGVPSSLLVDWSNGLATPQPAQLYRLLMALPEHQYQLLSLLSDEFSHIQSPQPSLNPSLYIPSNFYAQVLNGSMLPPQPLRFWTLSQMILQQALRHLDPVRLGLHLQLLRCMPPNRQNKIRSLRVVYELGTTPWRCSLIPRTLLLGAESLAGYAVSNRCSAVVHSQDFPIIYPSQPSEYTESQVAYPLMRAELVAGCLLVSSTQPAYFDSVQLSLVQQYADLLALAFESHEFYPPWNFDLRLLPPPSLQQEQLATFRQRLEALLSLHSQEHYDIEQLELQVWQQFEEEFLHPDLLAS